MVPDTILENRGPPKMRFALKRVSASTHKSLIPDSGFWETKRHGLNSDRRLGNGQL